MKKNLWIRLALIGLALLMTGTEALAKTVSVGFGVRTSVMAVLKIDYQHQENVLSVTDEDIQRGYVNVRAGTVYLVMTNKREGYTLAFQVTGGPIKSILMIDGGRTIELRGDGGFITMPNTAGLKGEMKELSYRFYLSEDAKPGQYDWPLLVDAATY